MNWTYDSHWQKAKLYAARASSEAKDSPLCAFWSSLTLELLARASLAYVHPALLADPSDKAGENILYAFGYETTQSPRSIPARTLFSRCRRIYGSTYTEEDENFCKVMADRRNAELHSGELAFDEWKTSVWLARFYRVCDLLLKVQGKTLNDLFEPDETKGAVEMIAGMSKDWERKAKQAIEMARANFIKLSASEQEMRRARPQSSAYPFTKKEICPACQATGWLRGIALGFGKTRLNDQEDMLTWDVSVLPDGFECESCGLALTGHGILHAAGLGGQFTILQTADPVEYYQANHDPADYYEHDYGNC